MANLLCETAKNAPNPIFPCGHIPFDEQSALSADNLMRLL